MMLWSLYLVDSSTATPGIHNLRLPLSNSTSSRKPELGRNRTPASQSLCAERGAARRLWAPPTTLLLGYGACLL